MESKETKTGIPDIAAPKNCSENGVTQIISEIEKGEGMLYCPIMQLKFVQKYCRIQCLEL